jgi:uncharacterized protein (DUF1800 family)
MRHTLPRLSAGLAALLLLVLLAGTSRAAKPATAPVWDAAAARHLLSRAAFGGSPEEAARFTALPLDRAVDLLLDEAAAVRPPARPEWARDVWINTGRRWSDMSREEYLILFRRSNARQSEELNQLRAWWLEEMIHGKAPLREAMTLFWHGHFTSARGKINGFTQSFYQQNQTLRRHALGNFRQFLEAITLDPCMMAYLDMERSKKARPNENYARELLELFTLGVGHYTEKDIKAMARALTGWVLDAPPGSVKVNRPTAPDRLQFASITRDGMVPTFLKEQHDDGEKTILGKTGRFGGKDVLDIIVQQPACGRHLAGRLIDYFGASDPEGRLRERMAEAFVASKYEIRPMLRVLFTSPEFYAPASRGNHIKSPVRLLVGACRDLRLDVTATPSLAQLTVPLGQELFNPPTVKGWPSGTTWISASTLPLRYRLGEVLIEGKEPPRVEPLGRLRLMALSRDPVQAAATIHRLQAIDRERRQQESSAGLKVRFDGRHLVSAEAEDNPEAVTDAVLERLVVTRVRATTRAAVLEACKAVPAAQRPAVAARLILASPEYQVE